MKLLYLAFFLSFLAVVHCSSIDSFRSFSIVPDELLARILIRFTTRDEFVQWLRVNGTAHLRNELSKKVDKKDQEKYRLILMIVRSENPELIQEGYFRFLCRLFVAYVKQTKLFNEIERIRRIWDLLSSNLFRSMLKDYLSATYLGDAEIHFIIQDIRKQLERPASRFVNFLLGPDITTSCYYKTAQNPGSLLTSVSKYNSYLENGSKILHFPAELIREWTTEMLWNYFQAHKFPLIKFCLDGDFLFLERTRKIKPKFRTIMRNFFNDLPVFKELKIRTFGRQDEQSFYGALNGTKTRRKLIDTFPDIRLFEMKKNDLNQVVEFFVSDITNESLNDFCKVLKRLKDLTILRISRLRLSKRNLVLQFARTISELNLTRLSILKLARIRGIVRLICENLPATLKELEIST